MTDDEAIATAMLHSDGPPFWFWGTHPTRGHEVWQTRRGENYSPMEMEIARRTRGTDEWRYYFISRAEAAHAYCEHHGLKIKTGESLDTLAG